MYALLITLFIIVCALMVVVILLQASKGGGLASSLGGMATSGGVLGARGAANILQKTTVGLAVFWGLLCILISFMSTPDSVGAESATQRRLQQESQAQPETALPLPEEGMTLPEGAAQPAPADTSN